MTFNKMQISIPELNKNFSERIVSEFKLLMVSFNCTGKKFFSPPAAISFAVDNIDSVNVVPDLGIPTIKINPFPLLGSILFAISFKLFFLKIL